MAGERTRESALDPSPPANRSAAVSPMGGGAARKDQGQGWKVRGADASCAAGSDTQLSCKASGDG